MKNRNKIINIVIISIVIGALLWPEAGYALRPPLLFNLAESAIYRSQILIIRDLLSMVNDKTIKREDIKAKIITALLSIQRDKSSLFTQKQAVKIASLMKLGERLPVLEYLISYQVEENGRKKFLFNGDHIARILRSSRKETEIKSMIETLKGLGITEGTHVAMILESSR